MVTLKYITKIVTLIKCLCSMLLLVHDKGHTFLLLFLGIKIFLSATCTFAMTIITGTKTVITIIVVANVVSAAD